MKAKHEIQQMIEKTKGISTFPNTWGSAKVMHTHKMIICSNPKHSGLIT